MQVINQLPSTPIIAMPSPAHSTPLSASETATLIQKDLWDVSDTAMFKAEDLTLPSLAALLESFKTESSGYRSALTCSAC